jgi:RNA polymerase sigma factor (sigma-70 family)
MSAVKSRASKEPSARSATDGELLARVAQGETAALGALYDRYAPMLLRFARRLERQEAEDIVQTVFMRVLGLAASFDPAATSARPWLFAITARVAMERRRSLRRWKAALVRLAGQPLRAAPTIADTSRDLDRGLAQLSAAKRTVLVLAEVEGFGCDEIASMLSIPVGTVWTRLHHARRELRQQQEHGEL